MICDKEITLGISLLKWECWSLSFLMRGGWRDNAGGWGFAIFGTGWGTLGFVCLKTYDGASEPQAQ
jgi:hypothetical protein